MVSASFYFLLRRKLSYGHGSGPQPRWRQLWRDPQHPQVSKIWNILMPNYILHFPETIFVASGMPIAPNRSAATPWSTRTPTTGLCVSSRKKWLASKTSCMRRVWETSSRVSVHARKRLPRWLRANIWSRRICAVYFLWVWACLTLIFFLLCPISISLPRPGHHWFEMCVCSNSSRPALCKLKKII